MVKLAGKRRVLQSECHVGQTHSRACWLLVKSLKSCTALTLQPEPVTAHPRKIGPCDHESVDPRDGLLKQATRICAQLTLSKDALSRAIRWFCPQRMIWIHLQRAEADCESLLAETEAPLIDAILLAACLGHH